MRASDLALLKVGIWCCCVEFVPGGQEVWTCDVCDSRTVRGLHPLCVCVCVCACMCVWSSAALCVAFTLYVCVCVCVCVCDLKWNCVAFTISMCVVCTGCSRVPPLNPAGATHAQRHGSGTCGACSMSPIPSRARKAQAIRTPPSDPN